MSHEEFELMPHPFGWKVEYWDNEAHLTPREVPVHVRLGLKSTKVLNVCEVADIESADADKLTDAFFKTFRHSVEFFNWPVAKIRSHAAGNIRDFFNGVRGRPLPISSMAIDNRKKPLGLALFVQKEDGLTELDLLFVSQHLQRRGIASQLVGTAVNSLFDNAVLELRSAYYICNEDSRQWHTKFGFEEIPDQTYIRMKYYWCRHEIWRLTQIGDQDKIPELVREEACWYAQLDDLWKR